MISLPSGQMREARFRPITVTNPPLWGLYGIYLTAMGMTALFVLLVMVMLELSRMRLSLSYAGTHSLALLYITWANSQQLTSTFGAGWPHSNDPSNLNIILYLKTQK